MKTPNILFFSDPFLTQCAVWLKEDSEKKGIPLSHYEIFVPYARLIPIFHQTLMGVTDKACALPDIKTLKTPFGYEHSVHSHALPISDLSFQGRFLKEVRKYLGPRHSLVQAQNLAQSLLQVCLDVAEHHGRFEDLNDLVPEKLSQHFQKTYAFLKKFAFLPVMRQYIQRFQQFQEKQNWWLEHPPQHPIIAIGFCPFFPCEKQALEAITKLDQGTLIFHTEAFQIPEKQPSTQSFARALMPKAETFAQVSAPMPTLYLLETQSLEEEAFNIALLMHQAPGKSLLVCKIPEIYERVVQHLRYLGASVLPEIPQRYQDHPLGVFLQLLLDVLKNKFSAASLLALAQNPMVYQVPLHAKAAQKTKDFFLNTRWIQPLETLILNPKMRLIATIWHAVQQFFQPLIQLSQKTSRSPLKDWMKAHLQLAERFTPHLFTVETQEMGLFFKECILCSHDYPLLSFQDYIDLFQSFLQKQHLRSEPQAFASQKYVIHDIETARLITAERVIICGLNEGMMPFFKRANPWVNNAMKQKLNLPMESDEIAKQTELFVENIKGKEVFLTRCIKMHSETTLPSRFWTYIQTYADPLLYPASPIHLAQRQQPSCFSPCIFLPSSAWPTFFSVSDLQLLFQNPYAFYIKKILQLKTLSFPQNKRTALEKGLLIHALLEEWAGRLSKQFPHSPPIASELSKEILYDLSHQWAQHYGFSEKQELKEQLEFFHMQNSALFPQPWQILAEKSGKTQVLIDGKKVVFYAKADRIDRIDETTVRIIDYKTGQLPTLKAIKDGESVQLIMEAFLAFHHAFDPSSNKRPPQQYAIDKEYLEGPERKTEMCSNEHGILNTELPGRTEFSKKAHVESIQAWQLKSPLSKSHVLKLSQDLENISDTVLNTFSSYFTGKRPLRCLKTEFDIDLISRLFET